jgi:hypothetical protein
MIAPPHLSYESNLSLLGLLPMFKIKRRILEETFAP